MVVDYLKTPEDSAKILEKFNGFHDGFIHKLLLRSHDVFTKEGPEVTDIVHQCSGQFDVRIDFAHHNYGQGTQPHDRIVRGFFKNVQDFCLDLRSRKSCEWPIKNTEILAGTREREGLGVEPSFSLTILWSQLHGQHWEISGQTLFTFAEAEFEERTLS